MLEWIYAVQKLIDFIDENAADNPSLEEIAKRVGYSGQNSLTRAFKDAYGCTPAAYRKNPDSVSVSMDKIHIPLENYIKGAYRMANKPIPGGYAAELKKIEDNKYLIGMVSVDEILRFGYEVGLSENSRVLDLTYGYGTILKVL